MRRLLLALFLSPLAAEAVAEPPTFTRDIAPILFAQCAECHHAGGIAPFPLTDFREVKKRAKTIGRVTASRFMPPWPPEAGHGEFLGERRLTEAQIATIRKWMQSGMAEGAAHDLPPVPTFRDGWKLGEPDLILTPPKAYPLPSEGPDTYRNLVLHYEIPANRFVRALEFHPGETSAVHHAFVLADDTGDARRLESLEAEPGFPGMLAGRGAHAPGGFVSWQPGRRPVEAPEGMSWMLKQGGDLILQLHLRSTGKPEDIQPSIGLYFTDQSPVRSYLLLLLRSTEIDIPAGEPNYPIQSSYKLAADVSVIGLAPHQHYLGKQVHGWAELPDGTSQELILIKQWDFNWQGDYRFAKPVSLPKGTTVKMRFTYDNSAQNKSNHHNPPQRVQYGLQSSDEMGELWLWLETKGPAELQALQRDYFATYGLPDKIAVNQALLRYDPKDAASRTELAIALSATGKVDEALTHLHQALTDHPENQRACYTLGLILAKRGDLPGAEAAFASAVRIDPNDANAQNNLGAIYLAEKKPAEAIPHLEAALRLNPTDALARKSLDQAKASLAR